MKSDRNTPALDKDDYHYLAHSSAKYFLPLLAASLCLDAYLSKKSNTPSLYDQLKHRQYRIVGKDLGMLISYSILSSTWFHLYTLSVDTNKFSFNFFNPKKRNESILTIKEKSFQFKREQKWKETRSHFNKSQR